MRVSVIIPSFQSAATIRACLASVLAQDLGEPFEVLVADSGTDDTADIARRDFPGVRLLKSQTRLEASLARNWGACEGHGSILAFIDSDCVAERAWLRRLVETIDSGYDGAGGAIANAAGANSVSWAGYFCEFREFLPLRKVGDATYLTPGNVAYRSDVFKQAGGFPGGYFPLEDQAFYERLKSAVARIRFDPLIVVTHSHRTTVSAFLAHQAKIGAANSRVVRVLGLRGRLIASHGWIAGALFPALTTFRFARTVAACWRVERCLLIRQPTVAILCWLGMLAWGVGFTSPSAIEARLGHSRP